MAKFVLPHSLQNDLNIFQINNIFFLQPHYLIKYKGYPDEENTWEPTENLNCTRLIRKFEKELLQTNTQSKQVSNCQEFERILAKRTVAGGSRVSVLF